MKRGWAKGSAYTHTGPNTMNTAIAWIAPQRNVALLVCTNDSDPAATQALDNAVFTLLDLYEKSVRE